MRLCNNGCEVILGRWGLKVDVRYKGKVMMKARKSTINGLWYVPITDINREDNLEQTNKSEVNPHQQGQERIPPKPPNIKVDFEPPIHRNSVQLRIRNSLKSPK